MGAYQSNDHAMDGMGNLRDRREMENNSREHQQCLTLLRKRENLKVADFNTWWNKNGMKCLKEKGVDWQYTFPGGIVRKATRSSDADYFACLARRGKGVDSQT